MTDRREKIAAYRASRETALDLIAQRGADPASHAALVAAVRQHLDAIDALAPALVAGDVSALPEYRRHAAAISALLAPHVPPIGGTALAA